MTKKAKKLSNSYYNLSINEKPMQGGSIVPNYSFYQGKNMLVAHSSLGGNRSLSRPNVTPKTINFFVMIHLYQPDTQWRKVGEFSLAAKVKLFTCPVEKQAENESRETMPRLRNCAKIPKILLFLFAILVRKFAGGPAGNLPSKPI